MAGRLVFGLVECKCILLINIFLMQFHRERVRSGVRAGFQLAGTSRGNVHVSSVYFGTIIHDRVSYVVRKSALSWVALYFDATFWQPFSPIS